jgi:hypothetical protein
MLVAHCQTVAAIMKRESTSRRSCFKLQTKAKGRLAR